MKAQHFISSRKTPVAVAILAIALIGLSRIGSLTSERYLVKQIPVSAQVASRKTDSEAGTERILIAINYSVQGWHGSRLKGVLTRSGELLGLLTDIPEPLQASIDLIAVDVPTNKASNNAIVVSHLPAPSDSSFPRNLVAREGKLYLIGIAGDELEENEEDDLLPDDSVADLNVWQFDGTRFIELGPDEARNVMNSVASSLASRRTSSSEQAASEADQSTGWRACTEPAYSFKPLGRCPVKAGGSTWTLTFTGRRLYSLDGPIVSQLNNSDGREKISLTGTSNVWVETDATTFGAKRNKAFSRLSSYSGIHFAYGWGVLGLLVAFAFPILLVRNALSRATNSRVYFPEAKPEDFPGLDTKKLEYYCQFLLANGFRHLRDFTIASASPSPHRPPSFCRLFVNPDSKCFAEVSQIFTPQKESAGMQCCFLTAFEGGWRFSTTDRVMNSLTYIARRPRTLWLSRPGMTCVELLALHGQMVTQMTMQLGLSLVEDVSAESHLLRSTQSLDDLNKIIRRKSLLVLPLILQYQYHETRRHYDWLGHSGLTVPSSPWTPTSEEAQDTSWSATVTRWSPVLNFGSTVMIAFSAFLIFFDRYHIAFSVRFNLAVFALGLVISAVVAVAKKQSANR